MTQTPQPVTRLLRDWSHGDPEALPKLMPLVCDELRKLARLYLDHETPWHTLQPTALVNELYLHLHSRRKVNWQNRAHFFGFAAQTMRRILVDHARSHLTVKRGEGARPLPLETAIELADHRNQDLVALDDALTSLATFDPRQSLIVELRFFIGLSVEDSAKVLEISTATVKRDWRTAKLWLQREMNGTVPSADS